METFKILQALRLQVNAVFEFVISKIGPFCARNAFRFNLFFIPSTTIKKNSMKILVPCPVNTCLKPGGGRRLGQVLKSKFRQALKPQQGTVSQY
jgi:hypothetical protein